MSEREERDTEPAPPPHLVCSVCGGVVEQARIASERLYLMHTEPICAHWRANRAAAIAPELSAHFKDPNAKAT